MPLETAVQVAAIILVFAAFGGTLAWASFFTRNCRSPNAQYFGEANEEKSPATIEEKPASAGSRTRSVGPRSTRRPVPMIEPLRKVGDAA